MADIQANAGTLSQGDTGSGQGKVDFENTPLSIGDEVIFSMTGILGRGRILTLDMPGVFGCVFLQSLIDPTRTMAVLSRSCVLIERPPLTASD